MNTRLWIRNLGMVVLCVNTLCAFAQPATSNSSSNPQSNDSFFLPRGFKPIAASISVTNETFKRAFEYLDEIRPGQQRPKLPEGLTQTDISNAFYMVQSWKTLIPPRPIAFYGKVVDEKDRPVAGAVAHFQWDGMTTNKSAMEVQDLPKITADVITDSGGLFSLTNVLGTELSVSVGKPDFYVSRRNRGVEHFKYSVMNFESSIGMSNFFRPDSNNPVIYYLHKMGVGVNALVTSTFGIREDFGVNVPRDGTPVSVDLLNRKVGNGSLEIRQTKPDYPAHGGIVENLSPSDRAKLLSATNWTFEMKIKDGGFVETDDEFAFHPPESGYQPAMHYGFNKAQTNWTTQLQKGYYIKLGNSPLYGHLQIETSSYQNTVTLWYVINPDGSRNLETKQDYFPSSSHWRY